MNRISWGKMPADYPSRGKEKSPLGKKQLGGRKCYKALQEAGGQGLGRVEVIHWEPAWEEVEAKAQERAR